MLIYKAKRCWVQKNWLWKIRCWRKGLLLVSQTINFLFNFVFRSCYKYNAKRINANETLLPLNTERSVALKNGGYNNGFQRSLVLSMQTLGGAEISRKVKSMFPTIKMVDKKTINEWIRDKIKKVENADNLAKFLRANQKTYTGLTSDMVDHLLIYEHSITNDVKEASERLSKLFYCTEDKDKFAESIVQVSIQYF